MPKGFTGLREAAAEIEARRQSGGGNWAQWFKLPGDGDMAVVRFLESDEEIAWAWMHQLSPRDQQRFGDNEPCLNTNNNGIDCPGCESSDPKVRRRFVRGFINIIWRDGPVWDMEEVDGKKRFKKDSAGKLVRVGSADINAVWQGGVQLFEELSGLDAAYKGLTSRDFRITRKGTELNTKYTIIPADPDGGPQPLSAADQELVKQKYDLTPYITPREYNEWGTDPKGGNGQESNGNSGSAQSDVSPFLKPRS